MVAAEGNPRLRFPRPTMEISHKWILLKFKTPGPVLKLAAIDKTMGTMCFVIALF